MKDSFAVLAGRARDKTTAAISLLEASFATYRPFDPAKDYSPAEREPYDAMCDRYLRAVEATIKFFRSYELYLYAEPSETLRDLLNKMHKTGLIASVGLWIEMRDARNRVVHDYLPERLKELYDLITGKLGTELVSVRQRAAKLEFSPT